MTHSATEFAPRPQLTYPFKQNWNPEPGTPFAVADGVYWVRVPMPIALDHINLWLLRDGDGWVIVDSGFDASMCKKVWAEVFENFCSPASVHRIIVTHFHPDHIGLAAWLAHQCECKIWMTRGEFEHYRHIIERDQDQHYQEAVKFIAEMGFSERYQDMYVSFFNSDDKPAETRVQRDMVEFMADGDEFEIDGVTWRVVMGNGHSPEHACLLCEAKNVLIAGDQAIPRISSNVSVYVSNRHQDPLRDWLDSCHKLATQIAPDTVILPSHQEPFIGIVDRMEQLIYDHHAQLNRLRLKAREAVTTNQARKVLFDRELSSAEKLMAAGETLSHINYLLHRGELNQQRLTDGTITYQMREK